MNKSDLKRNNYRLKGPLAKKGYDWWWHNFTGRHESTGAEKAFYIEYFITNPKLSPDQIVLGQESPNKQPSYFMMNVGTWGEGKKQLHQFYPIKDVNIHSDHLRLEVAHNLLTETRIKGSCHVSEADAKYKPYMSDAGTMSWDLNLDKEIAYNVGYGASGILRRLNAFEMYWHAEGLKTQFDGHVILDGESYIVEPESSYGYSDKNWGTDFTSPWLWISSCHMVSHISKKKLLNSAIEIGGGQPKIFGIPIKQQILIGLYYEGEMIEFNFSKFWKYSRVRYNFTETDTKAVWNVMAKNKDYTIKLKLTCLLKDMLEINYEAPNGKKLHKHLLNGGNGKGTLLIYDKHQKLVDKISLFNAGCEYGEF